MPGAFGGRPGLRAEHDRGTRFRARRSPSTNRENASRARSTAASKVCAWPGSRTWAACRSTRACAPWWMGIARHLNRWGASSSRRSRTSLPPRSPFACCARGIRRILTARGCAQHPDAFKDTLKGEIEEGLRLTGADVARAETAHGQTLAALSGVPRKVRILRSAHHAVAAVRRQHAVSDGDRGREVRQLHRLDEVLLVHLGDRQSGGLGAGRLHAGRTCRLACRSSAATKRTSASCNWRTRSNRRLASARSARRLRR